MSKRSKRREQRERTQHIYPSSESDEYEKGEAGEVVHENSSEARHLHRLAARQTPHIQHITYEARERDNENSYYSSICCNFAYMG